MTKQQYAVKQGDTVFKRRSRRDLFLIFAPAFAITIIGFVVTYQFVEPAPPRHLTMATGSIGGAYHRSALKYKEFLAKEGVELELIETSGSGENLKLLREVGGNVDLAFIQGDVGSRGEARGVESLGSMFFEPLWFFVREPVPRLLTELAGRTIAVGNEGSGSRDVLIDLLDANGLSESEVTMMPIGGTEAQQAIVSAQVSAAGFVSVYNNPYIQTLLNDQSIQLMPFVRADAYQALHHFLARVVLPRGVVDLELDIPSADIPLIALVANLAVRDSIHPVLVTLLLNAAEEIHEEGDLFGESNVFPSEDFVVLPLNENADRFYTKGPPLLQQYLPFWLAVALDRLALMFIPLITLLYPLFKILPPTYRWRMRARVIRYYRALLEVESKLKKNPTRKELDHCRERLRLIEEEVRQVVVPIGFADTLYTMRLHLKLVQERVENVIQEIDRETPVTPKPVIN